MGYLEELDEHEAERELRVKREYEDVFPLFHYCVLTQDGTYLCNKLQVNKLEIEGRPYFEVEMEDAWIWDPNRPLRLLEQVQIYTFGDLTIETIKSESGNQLLTADDVSKRSGHTDEQH